MTIQQADLSNPITLILLIIAIILVAIILYLGTRLIAGKKETETGYIIRLLLVAAIIVILVAIIIGAIVGSVSGIPLVNTAASQLVPVLIYLAIVFLIKYILIPEKDDVTKWSSSIWIGVITLFLIYLFNALTDFLFLTPIISGV
ncbi:MAG: hypothetical protein ACXAC8_09885 [Candidatus Hodarchaeales archaeon]|jgi:hypothetical protein